MRLIRRVDGDETKSLPGGEETQIVNVMQGEVFDAQVHDHSQKLWDVIEHASIGDISRRKRRHIHW
jgi:hypothetical protein